MLLNTTEWRLVVRRLFLLGAYCLSVLSVAAVSGCNQQPPAPPKKSAHDHAGHDHSAHAHDDHKHDEHDEHGHAHDDHDDHDDHGHDDHDRGDHKGHNHDDHDDHDDHKGHDHGDDSHDDSHDDHDHAHDDHHDPLELSAQAQGNIGLRVMVATKKPYTKTVAVPAMVVEQPGLSRLEISAPLAGIITNIFHTRGESVTPGEVLFTLRLTHEEVVETQREFLGTLEELDVVNREIERLREVTQRGAIAGKTLLARNYEKQKLEASLRTLREALQLHALTIDQIHKIQSSRKLFKQLDIVAPKPAVVNANSGEARFFQVQELLANVGKHVSEGDSVAVLTDYGTLYLEGRAFQRDAAMLEQAQQDDAEFTALFDAGGKSQQPVGGLQLAFIANSIDAATRSLSFYCELSNELVDTRTTEGGRSYARWKYRPGQRGQILIPTETLNEHLIFPADTVVDEGAESYVFVKHGKHFDRTPVHVVFRDQQAVAIKSSEQLHEGDEVVVQGAYQMHLTMKNKAGGGIDPHAGHNH